MVKKFLFLLFFGLFFKAVIAQEATFLPDSMLVIRDVQIEGNKITKRNILLRELVFSIGDSIPKMQLISSIERSRENILNLSLFNFVNMDVEHYPNNRIDVIIKVQERWYIWPAPIFEHGERNLSTFLREPRWYKLNYGLWLKWNNFRGRNEILNAKIRLGYKEQYVLEYEKPNLGAEENFRLSLAYSLNRQHRVKYITEDNLPVYFRDEDNYAYNTADAAVALTYRPGLYSRHRLRLHYVDDWVSDTVSVLNPNFFGEGHTRYRHFKIDYVLRWDKRDSKIYPLEGNAYKLKVQRYGLGIITDYPYQNWELEGAVFHHQKIASRLYFADVAKGKISSNKDVPLVQQKALGYVENITGYDSYVIDGTDYIINKAILKYELIRPMQFSVPYLSVKQFSKIHFAAYLNLFADLGYVYNANYVDPSNYMVNELQYSMGFGIDFVTYYDKVLGVGYSLNRYGMHGFFFYTKTPFFGW